MLSDKDKAGGFFRRGRPCGIKRMSAEKKRRRGARILRAAAACIIAAVLAGLLWYFPVSKCKWKRDAAPEYVQKELLTLNPYSRPGKRLTEVKAVVIHYVANPGSSAIANRNYFEHLWLPPCNPSGTKASSHFIVGLSGEVIQCIPTTEIAYANYPRNFDTVSIEVCHPDATGQFSDVTYRAAVRLAADLLEAYGLDEEALIRHYDVSGKNCPKYYVENEEAWLRFKSDAASLLSE